MGTRRGSASGTGAVSPAVPAGAPAPPPRTPVTPCAPAPPPSAPAATPDAPATPGTRAAPSGAPVTRTGAPRDVGLRVEVCTTTDAFGALADEWGELCGRCSAATPFQSHAWLYAWWCAYGTRRFGRDRGLRVVLVRAVDAAAATGGTVGGPGGGTGGGVPDHGPDAAADASAPPARRGALVAAAALLRTHRPWPVLLPLGGAISDFSDVLLDDAHAARVAPVLADALAGVAGGALIDFPEVRPGAAVERVFACWPGPRRTLTGSVCLDLPGGSMDELVARLPASRAQRVRANLRKLAALGPERRVVPPDEVPGALRGLLDLHRAQWQGRARRVTREHLRPRFRAHLEHAVQAMAARGEAAVTEFRFDGVLLAADLTLLAPGLTGGYLYGAEPRLRDWKVDVMTMLVQSSTLHGACRPAGPVRPRVLSLLRGDEPHKHHWRPETVVNQRLLLAGRHTGALLHATLWARAVRTRAKALLRAVRERHGNRRHSEHGNPRHGERGSRRRGERGTPRHGTRGNRHRADQGNRRHADQGNRQQARHGNRQQADQGNRQHADHGNRRRGGQRHGAPAGTSRP